MSEPSLSVEELKKKSLHDINNHYKITYKDMIKKVLDEIDYPKSPYNIRICLGLIYQNGLELIENETHGKKNLYRLINQNLHLLNAKKTVVKKHRAPRKTKIEKQEEERKPFKEEFEELKKRMK